MSHQTMQGIATANTIAQEKMARTIHVAVTGDPETDLIAAFWACFLAIEQEPGPGLSRNGSSAPVGQRVCEYLAKRFKDTADDERRNFDMQRQLQQSLSQQASPEPKQWTSPTYAPDYTYAVPGYVGPSTVSDEAKYESLRKMKAEMIRHAAGLTTDNHT